MDITIALFGRTNVGKSTLFNRLVPKGRAMVDASAHLTRDCRSGRWALDPYQITLLDVPGWQSKTTTPLEAAVQAQSVRGLKQAQLILWLCDARTGITPEDEALARWLRKHARPICLLLNKCDVRHAPQAAQDAYRLGLGDAIEISALHGSGLVELESRVRARLADMDAGAPAMAPEATDRPLQIAILGRPNVGKSTLVNALAGAHQLVDDAAGTTREAAPISWQWDEQKILLYDTPGLRRQARARLERLARTDTLHAVRFAELVILLVPSDAVFTRQDTQLLDLVETEGRAVVICVNKMDMVSDKSVLKARVAQAQSQMAQGLAGIPIVPISALKKQGLAVLMRTVMAQHVLWNTQLGTAVLNRWLEQAQAAHAPPMVRQPAQRVRTVRLRYITQTRTRPPGFAIFGNTTHLPEAYLRYLRNDLRAYFKLQGVPIRLALRQSKNPYTSKSS